jgi:hypothetical protein
MGDHTGSLDFAAKARPSAISRTAWRFALGEVDPIQWSRIGFDLRITSSTFGSPQLHRYDIDP